MSILFRSITLISRVIADKLSSFDNTVTPSTRDPNTRLATFDNTVTGSTQNRNTQVTMDTSLNVLVLAGGSYGRYMKVPKIQSAGVTGRFMRLPKLLYAGINGVYGGSVTAVSTMSRGRVQRGM